MQSNAKYATPLRIDELMKPIEHRIPEGYRWEEEEEEESLW
ncbi:MAG: hypothetical protein ACE5HZ_05450 [Fidelibacterota bacterium]